MVNGISLLLKDYMYKYPLEKQLIIFKGSIRQGIQYLS